LCKLIPVFCVGLSPGERKSLPLLPHYNGPVLALCGPDGSPDFAGEPTADLFVETPPPEERRELWAAATGNPELAATLARRHRHGAGRIAHLGRLARHRAALDRRSAMNAGDVAAAAWIQEGSGLGGLAQALPDAIPEEALVTTGSLRQELERLYLRCLARDGLADHLGVSAVTRYHPGVRALFTGPSGTGKTLGAGWVAGRLGLPLYRVDLASVTSKYIGETEKNLAHLMARAEHAGVVLLFDEADSLFARRTEVRESNDRFANAQTNYLLQRIESFEGIAILTANSRSRFDVAFARRLDAVVKFPVPGPEERRRLWQSHLGQNHSLTVAELNLLASARGVRCNSVVDVAPFTFDPLPQQSDLLTVHDGSVARGGCSGCRTGPRGVGMDLNPKNILGLRQRRSVSRGRRNSRIAATFSAKSWRDSLRDDVPD
jgi:hypothetical protein